MSGKRNCFFERRGKFEVHGVMSFDEIAIELGISRECARETFNRAITKLQRRKKRDLDLIWPMVVELERGRCGFNTATLPRRSGAELRRWL